ncbi:MAG: DUF4426 domain-containing protein [Xanthomonadales bacterium]|nr:DUF4426 domain-containing protein [Xanthomonadales bacterium]
MPTLSRLSTLLLACLLLAMPALLIAAGADGERAHRQGNYTIHYNAIPSTALSADVARQYDIVRSAGRGLLNIAVLRDDGDGDDGTATAVTAAIQAWSHSLVGQRNAITLREIREQDAIYYIGQFRIRGEEHLRFELQVRPDGARQSIPVRFENHFIGR